MPVYSNSICKTSAEVTACRVQTPSKGGTGNYIVVIEQEASIKQESVDCRAEKARVLIPVPLFMICAKSPLHL